MGKTTVRKNVTMSRKIAEWIEERANDLGMSQSAVMVMAISDFIKQEKAMDSLTKMTEAQNLIKEWEQQKIDAR
jgi:hypothetical protein